jgi:hypothetical protein
MASENPHKVQSKLDELNSEEFSTPWVEIKGFVSMTGVDYPDTGGIKFDSKRGYPVKAFLNKDTGEVKLFTAKIFRD